jgi:hypothetical protein
MSGLTPENSAIEQMKRFKCRHRLLPFRGICLEDIRPSFQDGHEEIKLVLTASLRCGRLIPYMGWSYGLYSDSPWHCGRT